VPRDKFPVLFDPPTVDVRKRIAHWRTASW